jgi:DNA polymerase
MRELFIDFETFSNADIKECGAYRYINDESFEIIIVGYAFGDEDPKVEDMTGRKDFPQDLTEALNDDNTLIIAHNATFERVALTRYGYNIPIKRFYCTMVKCAYCGLPMQLGQVSEVLNLEEKKLSTTGKKCIEYFSKPYKEKKTGRLLRHYPVDDMFKWKDYKTYNEFDVRSEREIYRRLQNIVIPEWERDVYVLDQEINDRGILIDKQMAENAIRIDQIYSDILKNAVKDITGIQNPNSVAQLKSWLAERGVSVSKLGKSELGDLIKEAEGDTLEVLEARTMLGKASIKKYEAMLQCSCDDGRARGLFQFYGATRTGRWAGRLIQLQNLPQNHIEDLELARSLVKEGDGGAIEILYGNVQDTLSQLIRTAFIAPPGKTYSVADFSAIEARVIAWVAGENWVLDVFRNGGDIYCATASQMFGVPVVKHGVNGELRQKGKIAVLALGYEGSVGALDKMGGAKMGLSNEEERQIVSKWRNSCPNIVKMWRVFLNTAIRAINVESKITLTDYHNISFDYSDGNLIITIPSGRQLIYRSARVIPGNFGDVIAYKGMSQTTKKWVDLETYGGKITENIIQAIARDLLALAMRRLTRLGFKIVMHVHDENIAEVPVENAKESLKTMSEVMADVSEVSWASGLPLRADGYVTPFYKKD